MEITINEPLFSAKRVKGFAASPMHAKPRIRQAFLGVNMSLQHRGLQIIAATQDIDLSSLRRGEFVMFLNNRKNKIKLFGAGNSILYVRAPEGSSISSLFLKKMLYHIGAKEFSFNTVMKDALERELGLIEKPVREIGEMVAAQ